jgi:hypothetical protein
MFGRRLIEQTNFRAAADLKDSFVRLCRELRSR